MSQGFKGINLLPLRERFCDGQMVCRFLRPLSSGEPLVLAIPGGPGLSSRYLDPFMQTIAERVGANVATMDLPNHGESVVSSSAVLTYPDCLHLVARAVQEIQTRSGALFVFGQSMGARLAFDLLAELDKAPDGTLLTGFPFKFEISSRLISTLNELPLESEEGPDAERIHAQNWKKMLPVYASQPLAPEVFDALAMREKVPNGHDMLRDTPDIGAVAELIPRNAPLLIVEATNDPVVPDGNWETLRSLLPHATFTCMENVGHFPMVEDGEATLGAFADFMKLGARS